MLRVGLAAAFFCLLGCSSANADCFSYLVGYLDSGTYDFVGAGCDGALRNVVVPGDVHITTPADAVYTFTRVHFYVQGTLRFSGGPVTFNDCQSGSLIPAYGGALSVQGGAVTFESDVVFSNNHATGCGSCLANGGAVYIGSGSLTFMKSVKFIGNVADVYGPAIYCDKGTISFQGPVEFTNNMDQLGKWFGRDNDVNLHAACTVTFAGAVTTKDGYYDTTGQWIPLNIYYYTFTWDSSPELYTCVTPLNYAKTAPGCTLISPTVAPSSAPTASSAPTQSVPPTSTPTTALPTPVPSEAPTTLTPTSAPSGIPLPCNAVTLEQWSAAFSATGFGSKLSISMYDKVMQNCKSQGKMTSTRELAMFLAQIFKESAGFYYTRELACASGCAASTYCSKYIVADLCYYGRGYIQLTGLSNYEAFSAAMYGTGDKTLVNNPEIVADTLPLEASLYYWKKRVHAYTQDGQFGLTTLNINGGLCVKYDVYSSRLKNAKSRYAYYTKIYAAWGLSDVYGPPIESGCYTV